MRSLILITFLVSVFQTATASAQELRPVLNHQTALQIMSHCLDHASENEENVAIVVMDHTARTIASIRMDNAVHGVFNVATRKASSSAGLSVPTARLAEWAESNPALLSLEEVMPLRGGVPILTEDGILLGAIGVSGASSQFDEECGANAIVAAGLVPGLIENDEESEE